MHFERPLKMERGNVESQTRFRERGTLEMVMELERAREMEKVIFRARRKLHLHFIPPKNKYRNGNNFPVKLKRRQKLNNLVKFGD